MDSVPRFRWCAMVTRPRPRLASAAILSLLLPLTVVSSARAQVGPEPAVLTIFVHAADTGRPLAGALISTVGQGIQGTTDRSGALRLASLRSGAHTVEARYLGYARGSAEVNVVPGRPGTLRLDLPVQPLQLAEVRVRARRSLLETSGFNDRRSAGFGSFVTRDQIARMQPRLLSDVLRRTAGVSLSSNRPGGAARASMRGTKVMTGSCPIQYYIDGLMVSQLRIDDVPPEDVEGLEIYRGAATIPPVYNKGTALCGVVVIWTRDR